MTEVISVLLILSGIAFILQVVLERIKDILPILSGTYEFMIGNTLFEIAPIQFISLALGIGLMFAINQPISLFSALGYDVPNAINHIANGILISGGSGYIHNLIDRIEEN